MSVMKRVFSVILVAMLMLSALCISPISVSAATTKSQKVVTYNTMAGGTVSSRKNTYKVKANFWTKKKVTIYGKNSFPNAKTLNAFEDLAKFDVVVQDKNGKIINTYRNVSCGFSFKLPQWNKNNYTITITSKFVGYSRGSAYHQAAALSGSYYLKY